MAYSFRFSSNEPLRFSAGMLYLGRDREYGYDVGIPTERHAITVAGAGSGKGAAFMIPNLLRWPHNALVIDPKGEAAEHTAAAREAMGQAVYVLDPFHEAKNLPDRFRAKFNPLSAIKRNGNSLFAREAVNAIADGLVMRHDSNAAHWDGGGLSVIAGLIALVLDQSPAERCTLPEIRRLLTAPPAVFDEIVEAMASNTSFGNLPATAASKLTKTGNEAGHFVSTADENTKWLDSPAIADLLSESTFDLADLRSKPCTVYLVLPADMLSEHGRFLRLFVRLALSAMARGGAMTPQGAAAGNSGRRCLFILDEFFSLGYIDEIAKSAGLMRGYGVQLCPILQDIGQLETLYGRAGLHTFFGNSDAHIFFGNADELTLNYVSARLGRISADDIDATPPRQRVLTISPAVASEAYAPIAPPMPWPTAPQNHKLAGAANFLKHGIDAWGQLSYNMRQQDQAVLRHALEQQQREMAAEDADAMREYQHAMSVKGEARLAPDKVQALVGKPDTAQVARSMIVFTGWGPVLNLALAPYFLPAPPVKQTPAELQVIADQKEAALAIHRIKSGSKDAAKYDMLADAGFGEPLPRWIYIAPAIGALLLLFRMIFVSADFSEHVYAFGILVVLPYLGSLAVPAISRITGGGMWLEERDETIADVAAAYRRLQVIAPAMIDEQLTRKYHQAIQLGNYPAGSPRTEAIRAALQDKPVAKPRPMSVDSVLTAIQQQLNQSAAPTISQSQSLEARSIG